MPPLGRALRHGARAATCILLVSGCTTQPDAAQVQRDLSRHRADCRVINHSPGEGDSDTVYIHADIACTRAPAVREVVIGYARKQDGWRPFDVEFDLATAPAG